MDSRVQFANRKSVASATGYQARFHSKYFNINLLWNTLVKYILWNIYVVHKGYFTRKMLSKIQSGLYKELSASLKTLSFHLYFLVQAVIYCLWQSLHCPVPADQQQELAAAWASLPCGAGRGGQSCPSTIIRAAACQFLCNVCLTDNKKQIGFQWIRVA